MTSDVVKGFALFAVGSVATIAEWLREGSVLLTVVGAIFALIGGYWAMCAAKSKAETAAVELHIKELELQRQLDKQTRSPL